MGDQDWTTVTFTKKKDVKKVPQTAIGLAQAKASGQVTTERKAGVTNKSSSAAPAPSAHLRKLEEATDVFEHKTINRNLAQAIQQARLAKKMTQAQLATAINERQQIIQQYESGQALPNPQVLNKLDRVLGIHLPRK
jgi:putative transcription factor